MEKEYDFSNGERGKFFNRDAQFHLPVYLEPELETFLTDLAKKKQVNLSSLVNSILYKDKELIELSTI